MKDFAFWIDWSDLKMWEKLFVPLNSLLDTGELKPKPTFSSWIFEPFAGDWPALDLLLFLEFSLAEGWRTNCPNSSNKSEIPGSGEGHGIWGGGSGISEVKRSGALHPSASYFFHIRFMVIQSYDFVMSLEGKRPQMNLINEVCCETWTEWRDGRKREGMICKI